MKKNNNVTRGIFTNGSIFDVQKQSKLRKNSAITLIALVLTIVVLLILAGVTLNVIIGNNGILSKAKESKEKTEIAKYEEELGMCVLDLQIEEAGNFNMNVLRSKFVEKVKENENTDDIEIVSEEGNATIEGVYKGYEFTIDEKYVVHIGKKSTGIRVITELSPKGYTNQNVTATIVISCNNGISTIKQTKPSNETEINVNGAKEYTITKSDISENTIYEYEITDSQGNKTTKTIEITTIDKNAPADFTITAENTAEGLKITGTTTDAESGIDKYEYYAKKSTDSDYTKYNSNPITGLACGTYSVYAIAYDKAGNSKQSNTVENVKILASYSNITAQMVAENPETYYGLKVTNYTSINGQSDWRIFYSDWEEKSKQQNTNNPTDTHIFLITGDYINTTETNRINSATGMTTPEDSPYSVYWDSAPTFQTVDSTTLTRFKATEYALQSGIDNSKCVSTLLNDNNWSSYKDSGNKAEKAIGSPTVEMWMDSWNARYPGNKVYRNASTSTSNPGYYVGTSQNTSGRYIDGSVMSVGYNNKLYYPHTDDYNGTYGYWLASPSANSYFSVLNVDYHGYVNRGNYNYSTLGVRPVVSLNTGITVNAEETE